MATLDASSSRMAALDVSSEDESSPSARAWRWYASMGSPKRVLAPMVGQSELAFRQLVRRYGCDLAVTPMVHARMFATCDRYRADVLRDLGDAEDRPLLVPQGIARRGHYGAFLLEEPDLVCGIVEHLSTRLPVPVTVKIRLLSPTDAAPTIALAKRLVAAGASLLTLHGRTKEMKGQAVGEARWGLIKEVFAALRGSVPLIANGGMEAPGDLERCAAFTGADGAMASEGALEDPCIFGVASRVPWTSRTRRLAICRSKAPQLAFAKGHLHKLLFEKLQVPGREALRSA
ncbi:hypothetical protein JL720_11414 [Aureococcus anophagefferens]|nr:hypothetical protein JL720_11414 [Aureococcus anophagefferens]